MRALVRPSRDALLWICLALACAACAGPQTSGELAATPQSSVASSSAVGPGKSSVPDFELDTIRGDSVRLSDYLGDQVILLDFWATYCDPCLLAMPHLEELYQRYKQRGFVVLGVSIDGPESVARVRGEVQKLGVSFPILLDQETRVVALYNPRTTAPYSVLIGRDGSVIKKREGYVTGDTKTLDAEIETALAQTGQSSSQ